MGDVIVRQWGPQVYAAYLDLGAAYPVFVGTAQTRDAADRWGRYVLSDEDGSLETRCAATRIGGVSDESEHQCVGELGDARRERANARPADLNPIPVSPRKRVPA